jgi:hypothetical protein
MALDTTRTLGLGYIVKVDTAGTTTWVTLGKVTKATPPSTEVESVDTTVLADTREHMQGGIQKATEFSFSTLWVNAATTFSDLDTACKGKNNCNWQFVTPHATPQTHTIKGFIKSVKPLEVSNKESMAFDITVVTTDVITIS